MLSEFNLKFTTSNKCRSDYWLLVPADYEGDTWVVPSETSNKIGTLQRRLAWPSARMTRTNPEMWANTWIVVLGTFNGIGTIQERFAQFLHKDGTQAVQWFKFLSISPFSHVFALLYPSMHLSSYIIWTETDLGCIWKLVCTNVKCQSSLLVNVEGEV
ncbi:hypothetical protein E2542_SST12887 [Spatholobus suberectus]|nr:hypothetical protein E2542_SST12887 [Spatholobus suberectus]